ncbi:unnamed protein product [Ophioblennius macclurei]
MESARSAFHAQLASVMDSLLAAAVCEIAKIFESSLCEQQAELAQRTEEISELRCKLEKVERRHKVKGAESEDGEMSPGDREGGVRQQSFDGAGPSGEKDLSSPSDLLDGLGRLKEEVLGQDGVSIKHERAASRPNQGSITAQTSEESLSAAEQKQIDVLSAIQVKTKLTHWDQSARGLDRRPLRDQGSTPFLAISQSGRCSPRTDPTLTQPGEWLPGLDATRSSVTSLENLQADGSGTGADAPCFRPGFGSDETSNDGEESFPFLDQEPENQNSNQNSAHGQGVGHRGTQQDHSQINSSESPWRSRDDRGARGPINNTRRITNFGSRDPLRLQLNSQSLTLRHTISLNHPPTSGGGTGRPYTCPYCTKCFTYPSHQRRHLLRHTGVRLHPCQFCEKSFLTPSELTVHTRTHTGERPFGCAQCGKRFARSGNLRAHQRDVHMGKRPFACTECGKRFAHRGNLRVHNHRVHQGDPYYMDDQPEPDIGPNPI